MLSLNQLRHHLFPVFKLMKKTGHSFEVVHEGVVYDLVVRRTTKKPKISRAKKSNSRDIVQAIDVNECPECGEIMFSGICMNQNCAQ
jgi:ribosomal protein L32